MDPTGPTTPNSEAESPSDIHVPLVPPPPSRSTSNPSPSPIQSSSNGNEGSSTSPGVTMASSSTTTTNETTPPSRKVTSPTTSPRSSSRKRSQTPRLPRLPSNPGIVSGPGFPSAPSSTTNSVSNTPSVTPRGGGGIRRRGGNRAQLTKQQSGVGTALSAGKNTGHSQSTLLPERDGITPEVALLRNPELLSALDGIEQDEFPTLGNLGTPGGWDRSVAFEPGENVFANALKRLAWKLDTSGMGRVIMLLKQVLNALLIFAYFYERLITNDTDRWTVLRPSWLYYTQVGASSGLIFMWLIESVTVHRLSAHVLSTYTLLDIITLIPILVLGSPAADGTAMYIPTFLRVWDIQRSSYVFRSARSPYASVALSRLLTTGTAILVTTMGLVNWLEYIDGVHQIELFDAGYFVLVTFSTVGYGDITPTTFGSKITVMVVIIFTVAVVPGQVRKLVTLQQERSIYTTSFDPSGRPHVIVTGNITRRGLVDFLHEFFHPFAYDGRTAVVVLSSSEPDTELKNLLRQRYVARRVTFLVGSSLNHRDTLRAGVPKAAAAFMLVDTLAAQDPHPVDEAVVLRSWSLREANPDMAIYAQLISPANVPHLTETSTSIICLNRLKMLILAYNCICPGASTLLSNMFSIRSLPPSANHDPWLQEYSYGAMCSVFHYPVHESLVGVLFHELAAAMYQSYEVTIFGVVDPETSVVTLAPPTKHKLSIGEQLIVVHRPTDGFREEFINVNATEVRKSVASISELFSGDDTDEDVDLGFAPSPSTSLPAPGQTGTMGRSSGLLRKLREASPLAALSGSDKNDSNGPEALLAPPSNSARHRRKNSINAGSISIQLETPETPAPTTLPPPPALSVSSDQVDLSDPDTSGPAPVLSHHLRSGSESSRIHPKFAHLAAIEPHVVQWDSSASLAPTAKDANRLLYSHVNFTEHIVVICDSDHDLKDFVMTLRSHPLFASRPIVILTTVRFRHEHWARISMFSNIYFVRGSARRALDLARANVAAAWAIVFPSSSYREAHQHSVSAQADAELASSIDASTIMSMSRLTSIFPDIKANVIAEMVFRANIRFVEPKPRGVDVSEDNYLETYILLPTYAAGRVYSNIMLDSLLYHSYYQRYAVDIMHLLLGKPIRNTRSVLVAKEVAAAHRHSKEGRGRRPSRAHIAASAPNIPDKHHPHVFGPRLPTHLVLIRVPQAFHGRTYRELHAFLTLEKGYAVLGLYRAPQAVDLVFGAPGSETWNAQGLGSAEDVYAPLPYVYTNPLPESMVHGEDKVYTIMPEETLDRLAGASS